MNLGKNDSFGSILRFKYLSEHDNKKSYEFRD